MLVFEHQLVGFGDPLEAQRAPPPGPCPAAAHSWVANTPRPPAAPQISTFCPACSLQRVSSMRYAVKYTSPYEAASSQLSAGGLCSSCCACTLVNWAKEPHVVS